MKALLQFVPLLFMVAVAPLLVASYSKLSAFILGRRVVSWKNCVLFGYLVLLISILMRVLYRLSSVDIPLLASLLVGLMGWTVAGTWFFRARATRGNGVPLGLRGAGEIAAMSWVFVALTGGLFYWLATALTRPTTL